MEFNYFEDLGPQSDFWHLLTQGYINPDELCANIDDAIEINKAIRTLESFKQELWDAGILNEC